MGSLHNKKLKDTYHGVIHTEDEGPINDTWKTLQDGDGNPLPVKVKGGLNTGMQWSGVQDFTNASVIGISGSGGTSGTSGISGSSGTSGVDGPQGPQGPTEIINDGPKATIWTNIAEAPDGTQYGVTNIAANFAGIFMPAGVQNSIGIGYYGACFNNSIYLGHYGQAANDSIVIGHESFAADSASTANSVFGQRSHIWTDTGGNNTILGSESDIYPGNNGSGNNNLFGTGVSIAGEYNNVIGNNFSVAGNRTCVMGTNTVFGDDTVAIGNNNQVAAPGAAAIGRNLIAQTEDTLTIHKLQLVDWATTDFTDDIAAAAAGIPLGGVYHTAGILKIRIS